MTSVVHPYTMRLTLDILDHLGLNLYSNVPAVVAEAVANAWDADATTVEVTLDREPGLIVISDDGTGMTREDVNERYLTVGYRRRQRDPILTPRFSRHVMGRKGIGKLSLFSIADEIEVVTRKVGAPEALSFLMRTDEMRAQMKSGASSYHPSPLPTPVDTPGQGTRIRLRKLRRLVTAGTLQSLRRRLARRFSVIGKTFEFRVVIDGVEIGVDDRDYFNKIEYLWSVGDVGDIFEKLTKNAKRMERLDGVVDEDRKWRVTGWVGTFDEQKSIEDENNTISLLSWGKLVQEDVLSDLKAGGLLPSTSSGRSAPTSWTTTKKKTSPRATASASRRMIREYRR